MKHKFFLCLRPMVAETEDDVGHVKIKRVRSSPPVAGKNSGRRCRDSSNSPKTHEPQLNKSGGGKHVRQLSIKSKISDSSGDSPGSKHENKSDKDFRGAEKNSPVTVTNTPRSFSCEKSWSSSGSFPNEKKQQTMNSNGKIFGGPEADTGVYLMFFSLFFTIFLGRFVGILCTSIWLCFVRRRSNGGIDDRRGENTVAKSPESRMTEEYKKKVILEGLLERKRYHKGDSIKFFDVKN